MLTRRSPLEALLGWELAEMRLEWELEWEWDVNCKWNDEGNGITFRISFYIFDWNEYTIWSWTGWCSLLFYLQRPSMGTTARVICQSDLKDVFSQLMGRRAFPRSSPATSSYGTDELRAAAVRWRRAAPVIPRGLHQTSPPGRRLWVGSYDA